MKISTSHIARICLVVLATGAVSVLPAGSSAQMTPRSHIVATTATPRLVAIRAAHHSRFDRIVFVSGPPPSRQLLRYVNRLIADPSGRPIPIAGRGILAASFSPATVQGGAAITDFVAGVRLTGGCSSGGSTFSIADQIQPTLKQFATVDFVKLYDPAGHTERPSGRNDSIPFCLEP